MPCYTPLTGYYSSVRNASGKRGITFSRGASLSGEPLRLPCGVCIGCRLEKSRQWAMRCMHEARLHKSNCFLTLTYDNEHLPPGGTLVKAHLQHFMRMLRQRLKREFGNGYRLRFFGCGEYGDLNRRPHYHVLLFNCEFRDKLYSGQSKTGSRLFRSAVASSVWRMGNVILGDVSFESAAYVARYSMKKIMGSSDEAKALRVKVYDVADADGVVYSRVPEFLLMSRRPGIGLGWFKKYGAETYALDSVVVRGKVVRPPQYYDRKFALDNPMDFIKLQKARRRKMRVFRADNTPERRKVRMRVTKINIERFRRML